MRLGISSSTLSRIASDLVEAGYLVKSGYHRFEPALGLIRIGQNAVHSSHLPRTVNPLVRSRAEELGVNGAFAGVERGQLVYLFRSDAFSGSSRLGLPYRIPLFRSNIAIAILAMSLPPEEALECLRRDVHAHGGNAVELEEIAGLLEQVVRNGYLFRRETREHWNITFPVEYGGTFYGLAFYGDRAGERNFDRLLFECSLLASRLRSALAADGRTQGG
ncbi:hypothetical protein SDC9_169381 [bioreactor metagenome]|uniref:HTH iclR-type domain-containing protein n=1 Tax=bioreactor metagenome TaxID=1076179 RepID=A0A645G560_9ZZZZ